MAMTRMSVSRKKEPNRTRKPAYGNLAREGGEGGRFGVW